MCKVVNGDKEGGQKYTRVAVINGLMVVGGGINSRYERV